MRQVYIKYDRVDYDYPSVFWEVGQAELFALRRRYPNGYQTVRGKWLQYHFAQCQDATAPLNKKEAKKLAIDIFEFRYRKVRIY